MIDLDAKIRSLVERNIPRKDVVSELDAIASDPESRAKRFERAKKKGDRYRAESERALSARVECAELRAELGAQHAAHESLHTTVRLNAQIGKLKKRKAQLPRELQSIVDRLATSSAMASNQVSKLSEAQEAVAAAVSKHRDESHEGRAGH